ncbi:MAG: metallophosphoesterase [Oscillospiraceae bacterium]
MKKKFIPIFIITFIYLTLFGCANAKSEANKAAATNSLEASKDEYSIAMITDTQFYSYNNADIFYKMTKYLKDNQKRLNLAYIMHTGDLVEMADDEVQWKVASNAMNIVKDIPNGVLAGNHDTGALNTRRQYFSKYFGEQRYDSCPWYGESHNDNNAHYDLVTIGKTEFIFVYISDDPAQCCINFANKAFAQYPNRVGVLCVHNYLTAEKTLSPIGEYLKENVVSKNNNVKMVFCGHCSVTANIPVQFDDDNDGKNDRTVYQIIANYQNDKTGGYMLILKINETKKTINAFTYSPINNNYLQGESGISKSRFSFEVPWDM